MGCIETGMCYAQPLHFYLIKSNMGCIETQFKRRGGKDHLDKE